MRSVLLILAALAAIGCKKEKDDVANPGGTATPDCEANNYAYLTIGNADSDDAYDIYVDGTWVATIGAGGSIVNMHIPQGNNMALDAYEVDFLILQDHYSASFNAIECDNYAWNFP